MQYIKCSFVLSIHKIFVFNMSTILKHKIKRKKVSFPFILSKKCKISIDLLEFSALNFPVILNWTLMFLLCAVLQILFAYRKEPDGQGCIYVCICIFYTAPLPPPPCQLYVIYWRRFSFIENSKWTWVGFLAIPTCIIDLSQIDGQTFASIGIRKKNKISFLLWLRKCHRNLNLHCSTYRAPECTKT